MPNQFGESGKPDELLRKYKMKSDDIESAAKKVIKRKLS
jgi:transketolase C-terminal domain/subunit